MEPHSFRRFLDTSLKNTGSRIEQGLTIFNQYLDTTWFLTYRVNEERLQWEREGLHGKSPRCGHLDFRQLQAILHHGSRVTFNPYPLLLGQVLHTHREYIVRWKRLTKPLSDADTKAFPRLLIKRTHITSSRHLSETIGTASGASVYKNAEEGGVKTLRLRRTRRLPYRFCFS